MMNQKVKFKGKITKSVPERKNLKLLKDMDNHVKTEGGNMKRILERNHKAASCPVLLPVLSRIPFLQLNNGDFRPHPDSARITYEPITPVNIKVLIFILV